MELTTIDKLIEKLDELPKDTKVYVCGTTGYLHVMKDDNGNTYVVFDDNDDVS